MDTPGNYSLTEQRQERAIYSEISLSIDEMLMCFTLTIRLCQAHCVLLLLQAYLRKCAYVIRKLMNIYNRELNKTTYLYVQYIYDVSSQPLMLL